MDLPRPDTIEARFAVLLALEARMGLQFDTYSTVGDVLCFDNGGGDRAAYVRRGDQAVLKALDLRGLVRRHLARAGRRRVPGGCALSYAR